jgi:hypothetical protein
LADYGYADLRLLMPLGFGALALRQLWEKDLDLEEIPWYGGSRISEVRL